MSVQFLVPAKAFGKNVENVAPLPNANETAHFSLMLQLAECRFTNSVRTNPDGARNIFAHLCENKCCLMLC